MTTLDPADAHVVRHVRKTMFKKTFAVFSQLDYKYKHVQFCTFL